MKPGLSVRILEEPEQSEDAKREQAEAEQREKEDLVAQQTAADAAYRSFWVGFAQTIIAFFGAAGLIYSLHLNRKAIGMAEKATRAAEAGVKAATDAIDQEQANAQRALRAYVCTASLTIQNVAVGERPRIRLVLKNCGQTPAKNFKTMTTFNIVEKTPQKKYIRFGIGFPGGTDLGSDIAVTVGGMANEPLTQPQLDAIESGTAEFIVHYVAMYEDIFGVTRRIVGGGSYSGALHGREGMIVFSRRNASS